MRRVKLRVALMAAVVLFATGTAFVLWLPRVMWAKYDRINKGMSREEVEAILGPQGDFSGEDVVYDMELTQFVSWVPKGASRGLDTEGWLDDEAQVVVFFDDSGRAIEKNYTPRWRSGPVDDYLRRLRYRWRKWYP